MMKTTTTGQITTRRTQAMLGMVRQKTKTTLAMRTRGKNARRNPTLKMTGMC